MQTVLARVFFKVYLAFCVFVLLVAIPTAIIKHNKQKLVHIDPNTETSIIRLVDHETGRTFCSGTVISDNIIITAGHCVVRCDIMGCSLNKGIEIRTNLDIPMGVLGDAYYASPQTDTGLILGAFKKFNHRPYTTDVKTLGDMGRDGNQFLACGYPLGGDLNCTVFTYHQQYSFMWAGQADTLLPGMSGGPVMTADGRLVAINDAVDGELAIVSPIYNLDFNFQNISQLGK